MLPGPEGRIDFETERSVYSAGAFWKLYAPGRQYIGEPGEWELEEIEGLSEDDPFWLLLLLEATVRASVTGTETVLGTACQRYDAFADFEQARQLASQPVAPPVYVRDGEVDLARLRFEVWLDASGRIRRVILHGSRKSSTQLDLSGFGDAKPVDLPPPSEILPDEEDAAGG